MVIDKKCRILSDFSERAWIAMLFSCGVGGDRSKDGVGVMGLLYDVGMVIDCLVTIFLISN